MRKLEYNISPDWENTPEFHSLIVKASSDLPRDFPDHHSQFQDLSSRLSDLNLRINKLHEKTLSEFNFEHERIVKAYLGIQGDYSQLVSDLDSESNDDLKVFIDVLKRYIGDFIAQNYHSYRGEITPESEDDRKHEINEIHHGNVITWRDNHDSWETYSRDEENNRMEVLDEALENAVEQLSSQDIELVRNGNRLYTSKEGKNKLNAVISTMHPGEYEDFSSQEMRSKLVDYDLSIDTFEINTNLNAPETMRKLNRFIDETRWLMNDMARVFHKQYYRNAGFGVIVNDEGNFRFERFQVMNKRSLIETISQFNSPSALRKKKGDIGNGIPEIRRHIKSLGSARVYGGRFTSSTSIELPGIGEIRFNPVENSEIIPDDTHVLLVEIQRLQNDNLRLVVDRATRRDNNQLDLSGFEIKDRALAAHLDRHGYVAALSTGETVDFNRDKWPIKDPDESLTGIQNITSQFVKAISQYSFFCVSDEDAVSLIQANVFDDKPSIRKGIFDLHQQTKLVARLAPDGEIVTRDFYMRTGKCMVANHGSRKYLKTLSGHSDVVYCEICGKEKTLDGKPVSKARSVFRRFPYTGPVETKQVLPNAEPLNPENPSDHPAWFHYSIPDVVFDKMRDDLLEGSGKKTRKTKSEEVSIEDLPSHLRDAIIALGDEPREPEPLSRFAGARERMAHKESMDAVKKYREARRAIINDYLERG